MNTRESEAQAGLSPGRLAVATPQLNDPNFSRSVVLLCEVNDDGALGLILNRPSTLPVEEVMGEWHPTDPAVVFAGGPVQPEIAVGLIAHRGVEPIGFTPVGHNVGLFDLATPAALVSEAIKDLRVFSGYAGWGPGQLQSEVQDGDWIALDAVAADHFTTAPRSLWESVLMRQGGDIALLATFGQDPSLN